MTEKRYCSFCGGEMKEERVLLDFYNTRTGKKAENIILICPNFADGYNNKYGDGNPHDTSLVERIWD